MPPAKDALRLHLLHPIAIFSVNQSGFAHISIDRYRVLDRDISDPLVSVPHRHPEDHQLLRPHQVFSQSSHRSHLARNE